MKARHVRTHERKVLSLDIWVRAKLPVWCCQPNTFSTILLWWALDGMGSSGVFPFSRSCSVSAMMRWGNTGAHSFLLGSSVLSKGARRSCSSSLVGNCPILCPVRSPPLLLSSDNDAISDGWIAMFFLSGRMEHTRGNGPLTCRSPWIVLGLTQVPFSLSLGDIQWN